MIKEFVLLLWILPVSFCLKMDWIFFADRSSGSPPCESVLFEIWVNFEGIWRTDLVVSCTECLDHSSERKIIWTTCEFLWPPIVRYPWNLREVGCLKQNWVQLAERVANVMKNYPTLSLTHGRKVLFFVPVNHLKECLRMNSVLTSSHVFWCWFFVGDLKFEVPTKIVLPNPA